MSGIKRRQTAALAGKALSLLAFCGVAAMLVALFWVRESDIAFAGDELLRENSPSPDSTVAFIPKITRREFEFKEPVPGKKGKYRWKVRGRKSVFVNSTTDKIFDFGAEMVDGGDVMKLSSSVALFDKDEKERVLFCEGGVSTQLDIARLLPSESADAPSPSGADSREDTTPDEPKKKKKRSPLVITSQRFSLKLKKEEPASKPDKKSERSPMAVYTGNVVARDDSGIMYADKMEVWNYSEEDKKKNPKLKGIKTVVCSGNVAINQVEGKKQARCEKAAYDAKSNIIHLYGNPKTGKKVVYRDEEAMKQIKALELIFDRNKDEVIFDKEVETIDFSPDRKSFLGFTEPERTPPKGGEKPELESKKEPPAAQEQLTI